MESILDKTYTQRTILLKQKEAENCEYQGEISKGKIVALKKKRTGNSIRKYHGPISEISQIQFSVELVI